MDVNLSYIVMFTTASLTNYTLISLQNRSYLLIGWMNDGSILL
jgi:hypothetical protein